MQTVRKVGYMIMASAYALIGPVYYAGPEHPVEFTKRKDYGMVFASQARAHTVKAGLTLTYPGMVIAVEEVEL